jgi:uncharacterized membrane protein YphA (DoxX/SURF4 family)
MTDLSPPTSSCLDRPLPRRWPGRLWALVRILVGILFVVAGLPKFIAYDTWLHLFQRWQVPLPNLSVYVVGGFKIVGGLLLAQGLGATRLAVLFVIDMVGAIGFAGTREGKERSRTGRHLKRRRERRREWGSANQADAYTVGLVPLGAVAILTTVTMPQARRL